MSVIPAETDESAELEVFVMTDQPTECPRCGVRTDFDELPDGSQRHRCGRCGYVFLAVPDFEGEEQCAFCREFAVLEPSPDGEDGLCGGCVSRGVVWEDGEPVSPEDDPDTLA